MYENFKRYIFLTNAVYINNILFLNVTLFVIHVNDKNLPKSIVFQKSRAHAREFEIHIKLPIKLKEEELTMQYITIIFN